MQRAVAAVALAFLLAAAGCSGVSSEPSPAASPSSTVTAPDAPGSPTTHGGSPGSPFERSPESTSHTPTDLRSPSPAGTGAPTPTPRERATVEYVVRGAGALSEFRTLNVSIAVVFADGASHQCNRRLGEGTYTPRPTADPDRDLDCVRFGNLTVDLTTAGDARSLGRFTVPALVADDTYLVVRDVEGRYENGSRAAFADDDFAIRRFGRDGDRYGATLRVEESASRSDYYLATDPLDPPPTDATGYGFAVEGEIETNRTVELAVTHDGEPAAVQIEATGTARERYRTGADGTVDVRIADARVVEFEIVTPATRSSA